MNKLFPGYYRPSAPDFRRIWSRCVFILDANVLLSVYRYTPPTRKELISILNHVSHRLWVPHQAAFEYQRNRLAVIAHQINAYERLKAVLTQSRDDLRSRLAQEVSRHPYIDLSQLVSDTDKFYGDQQAAVDELKLKHPAILSGDPLTSDRYRTQVDQLLDGKIGDAFSAARKEEICKLGKERYSSQTPPGFADAAKPGNDQYGDLLIWFQILDKAKEAESPVILVTDERKEDWWWRFQGKTLGPRPELVAEMRQYSGQDFYMYQVDQFMEHAREYLESKVPEAALEEIRQFRKREEQYAHQLRRRLAILARDPRRLSPSELSPLARSIMASGMRPQDLQRMFAHYPENLAPLADTLYHLTGDPRWLTLTPLGRETLHHHEPPAGSPSWLQGLAHNEPTHTQALSDLDVPDWILKMTPPEEGGMDPDSEDQ